MWDLSVITCNGLVGQGCRKFIRGNCGTPCDKDNAKWCMES